MKKRKELRVVAPSRSMVILNEETINIATETLENMNLEVTFSNNIMKSEIDYLTDSIDNRVKDLHEAFKDPNVKYILTAIGGYNLNQILPYLDYDLIKNNPKIICGYSDITALLNAIYAKTGLITYHGPHYSSFGMKKGNEYTIEGFSKLVLNKKSVTIKSSNQYSDDFWFIDQESRKFYKNKGMKIANEGVSKGVILGGNLCTFNLLQGTEYMPKINDDIILFLEDDGTAGENFLIEFDRNLVSLIQTDLFKQVKGIVLGRAQKNCEMTDTKWLKLLNKKELKKIPIIYNADFGHTTPFFTFPIGGHARLKVKKGLIELKVKE